MIGSNIKRLRLERGMTQKNLADMLFVSAQAVSRWENNEVEPSLGTITEMAKIFGVSSDEILGIGVEESEEKEQKNPEPEIKIEKEYVYREAPPQMLALCSICNSPIYDKEKIVRFGDEIRCKDCEEKRKQEEREDNIRTSNRRRKLSFVLGPLATVAALLIWGWIGFFDTAPHIIFGIIFSISMFTLVSCCLFENNFIGDMFEGIVSWGFVRMPGVIFDLDLDGCLWFITVKLSLAILSILLAILCTILALIIGGFVSLFVYPFAIMKNIKRPEEID